MPKMKTKKALAKRCKRTATGKVKFAHAGASHLMSSKNRKRKRHLKSRGVLAPQEAKRLRQLWAS